MKVVVCSSIGGHAVQLNLLVENLVSYVDDLEIIKIIATDSLLSDSDYVISDISRTNWYKFPIIAFRLYKIISRENPDLYISTGAMPGLIGAVCAKCMKIKTIWVDSIANSTKLSASGRAATLFSDSVFTQWPNLAKGRVKYNGRVF